MTFDAVNDAIINDYLDWIDQQIAAEVRELWRLAYARGMVSAEEYARFLIHDLDLQETAT